MTPLQFERDRLLSRRKSTQLWQGSLYGKPQLILRSQGQTKQLWNDYLRQSRLRHSLLLQPNLAGRCLGKQFCVATPLEFDPQPIPADADREKFAVQLLSLIAAVSRGNAVFRWDPAHLVFDAATRNIFLPSIRFTNQKDDASETIARLRTSLGKEAPQSLIQRLKKWERRKEEQIAGCLRELLEARPDLMSSTFCVQEWPREKERELVIGFSHLVTHSRLRAVLFSGDPGEGKSTLLKQIYQDLYFRGSRMVWFAAEKEQRPLYSFRLLLDRFCDATGAYRKYKQDIGKSAEVPAFLRVLEKLDGQPCTFLIDDLHNFDPSSLESLADLVRSASAYPVLFVFVSRSSLPQFDENVVVLPLQPVDRLDPEKTVYIPFWKSQQRDAYLQEIFNRVSGNPLLFHEYVTELLRNPGICWNGESWQSSRKSIPAFPSALSDFYIRTLTEFSAEERRCLENASVQGESFDPAFSGEPDHVLQSLVAKGVLTKMEEAYRFRKPLLSEAICRNMEPQRMKQMHQRIASELAARNQAELSIPIAWHLVRAGELSSALEFACQAPGKSALPILEELESSVPLLSKEDQCRFYRGKADSFFAAGNYSAAAEAYKNAAKLSPSQHQFELRVRLAQSHLLKNDMRAAQEILQSCAGMLGSETDRKLQMDYYFARAICLWHRGAPSSDDFQKALAIAEELQDYGAMASGYYRQAELSLNSGLLAPARKLTRRALRFSEKANAPEEKAHTFRVLGKLAWRQSNYKKAEKILKRSILLFEKADNSFGAANVWSLLGNLYGEQCRHEAAEAAFQKALSIFNRLENPQELGLAWFNLGLLYIDMGKLKEAESIFQRCKAQDKKSGNKRDYAFDLRAFAVVCFMRGHYKKAARLLKHCNEILEALNARGDIIQTLLIVLLNELEQRNFKQAESLVGLLQDLQPSVSEPMTQAEIHYLFGHYYGYINESARSTKHLQESLKLAQKIKYHKLIGKNLILGLAFRSSLPAGGGDLKRAIRSFQKARNQLEFYDYLLKLYQAHPVLLRQREHARWLKKMEVEYRAIHNRPRHNAVRQLIRNVPQQQLDVEPLYEWWQDLLGLMQQNQKFDDKMKTALTRLCGELGASTAALLYGAAGPAYARICTHPAEKLPDFALHRVRSQRSAVILNPFEESELGQNSEVILHEVRSILAIPVWQAERVMAMWYFDRRGNELPFSPVDAKKAGFFALASTPVLEKILKEEQTLRDADPEKDSPFPDLIGAGASMRELFTQMRRLSMLDVSVLVHGESGTGKELIARNLHEKSPRCSARFVAVNCSALPDTLLESELFGYVRGAFTGANTTKPGWMEQADRGTLFLDEIGDLSAAAQAKLLRALEQREIQRLGDTAVRKVNIRLITATHKDLPKLIEEGLFRHDLYYRINGYTLSVPPLRNRKDDFTSLVNHFLRKFAQSFKKPGVVLTPAAMQLLCAYSWPGNVRELENVIQSLMVNMDPGQSIDAKDLPDSIRKGQAISSAQGLSLEKAREEFERRFLLDALERHRWNKTKTAEELKITRQGLINLIQRLGLKQP